MECKRAWRPGPEAWTCPCPKSRRRDALGSSLIRSGDCPSPSSPRLRPSHASSLVSWASERRGGGEKTTKKRRNVVDAGSGLYRGAMGWWSAIGGQDGAGGGQGTRSSQLETRLGKYLQFYPQSPFPELSSHHIARLQSISKGIQLLSDK